MLIVRVSQCCVVVLCVVVCLMIDFGMFVCVVFVVRVVYHNYCVACSVFV